MKRRRRLSAGALAAIGGLTLLLAIAVGLTSSPSMADRASALERELRCPVCQGISIADSPSTSAAQMRRVVAERLAAGASDEDVRAYFVARFGTWVLLAPASDGIGAVLWIAPGVAMVAGASFVLLRHVRRRMSDAAMTTGNASAVGGDVTRSIPAVVGFGLVVVAIVVPLAVAVVPRLAGQEISGRPASQALLGLSELEALVRARPDDVVAGLQLGASYLEANRTADAAAAYAAILRREPDGVAAMIGLGIALLDGGRPDGALTVFDRASALDPTIPEIYLYRALARYALERGATESTRADARRFIAMAPNDPRTADAQRLLDGPSPVSPRASP